MARPSSTWGMPAPLRSRSTGGPASRSARTDRFDRFGLRKRRSHSTFSDSMDPGIRSPLVDFFRRGEVARDVRLLAAQGALAPRAQEQLALLVLLADDPDPEIARATGETLDALPRELLTAFLSRPDVPKEMREFFAGRGIAPAAGAGATADFEAPLVDTLSEIPEEPGGDGDPEH